MKISNSFFEDEIREGFYIPASVKQAWGAQLKVFGHIDEVCRKHDIHYYADWGTFLGAVRHGGYIPWDDDLDIGMLRTDYEKFLKVSNELPDGFAVYNLRSRETHTEFLANVVNKTRICFEPDHLREYHGFPYIACVDIFIIDHLSNDPIKNANMFAKAKMVLGLSDSLREGSFDDSKLNAALSMIEEKCDVKIPRGMSNPKLINYLDVLAEKIFSSFKDEECDEVVQMMPWGLRGVKTQHEAWYESFVEIPFEEMKIPVPNRYLDALTARYGDFMKIYKDASGHDYPFFLGQKKNLQKLLDFELPEYTFDAALLSNECRVDATESYKNTISECLKEINNLWIEYKNTHEPDLLLSLQGLAIDLGEYMESVKGEGYDIVHILETMCESVYGLSAETASEDAVDGIISDLKSTVSRRKEAVFLPFKSEYFKTFENEYYRLLEDADTDVFVVPIPYYYKDYDGALKDMQYDLESYPEELKVIHCDNFDFALHRPDVIYFQYPYDEWNEVTGIPPFFHSQNLKNYTEQLIYIPWFITEDFTRESARNFKNMRCYVTMPGVVNADMVYVQSEIIRGTYIEALCDWAGEDTRSIWNNKIRTRNVTRVSENPDCLAECTCPYGWERCLFKADGSRKKIMLYHVETGSLVSDNGILNKIKRNLDVFEKAKDDVMLVWKEHSEVSSQLFEINPRMYEKYFELVNYFKAMDFGVYVTDISIDEYSMIDAYYGDPGVEAHRFRNMNKPVMIQNVEI